MELNRKTCSGTKDEEKRDIIDGGQRYICSRRLFKSLISIVRAISQVQLQLWYRLIQFTIAICAKHMGDIHGKHPCDVCGKSFG